MQKMNAFRYLSLCLAACAACTPGSGPLPAEEPAGRAEPVRVSLLFAGDVMQHMPQVQAARRDDGFDYAPVFEFVRPHFDRADLVVVNLETTLTRESRYTGYPCFRSPAALAGALADAGVDVAVLANNHCCDGGVRGLRTTVAELSRHGIRHTGAFADSADLRVNHPLLMKIRGMTFALLNYTYGTNGIPVPHGTCVNGIDTVRIRRDLETVRREPVDCVIACMHWGNEYERYENAEQRQLADMLRRNGVDLVIGSHPHVVQPYAADSTGAVFYSLGNFVSNQQRRYCDGGLMARIEATKHPDGRMTYAAEAIPVWIWCPGYRIVPPEAADTLPLSEAARRRCAQFAADTRDLLRNR